MVDAKVMEKLRKILTLAGNEAATQGEIEAAMARAKEIAMQHNISLGDVSLENPNQKPAGIDVVNDASFIPKEGFERKHHMWIFHIIKVVFGVRAITSASRVGSRKQYHRIWFIGEATDVEIGKAIFQWLDELFPTSCKNICNGGKFVREAAIVNGFYRGLAMGILEVNRRKEAEVKQSMASASANQYAMVLRNKEQAIEVAMEKYHPKDSLKERTVRNKSESGNAIGLGYAKGKSINLNQMGGSASARPQLS